MNSKPINEDKLYYTYFERGNFRLAQEKYDGALEDFDKAIELKPDYAPAHSFRGYVYEEKGEFERAIANYNKAIALKPDYAEAYGNRGVTYSKKGEFDRALEDLTTAIKLKPNLVEAYTKIEARLTVRLKTITRR